MLAGQLAVIGLITAILDDKACHNPGFLRQAVGLNKAVLSAETFYIVDIFNVGFVNVWGFKKVGPVVPSCSAETNS